jgi:hypothetical protein
MKPVVLTISVVLALGACTTASKVPLANGRKGFAVACSQIKQCYEKASQVCAPRQYEIEGTSGGGFGMKQELTITCKE